MDNIDLIKSEILAQQPTEEQQKAIFYPESEYLLRASPGSGKTWTACRRFIWRAANWNKQVGGLALFSYTNTAISEFKKATTQFNQEELLHAPNFVGTFDSFVEKYILIPFGHLLTKDKRRLILFTEPRDFDRANSRYYIIRNKRPIYAWDLKPFPKDKKIYFKYGFNGELLDFSKYKGVLDNFRNSGFYTHDQRAFLACELLTKHPQIAKVLARKFPEIIVDEAQDTNLWLLILLERLRSHFAKITLVGDPDQCIYEFSMAEVDALNRMKTRWSIPELPLSISFRCNSNITSVAKKFSNNDLLTGVNPINNELCKSYVCDESEVMQVFQELINKSLVDKRDSAILCRGHNNIRRFTGRQPYEKLQGISKDLAVSAFYRDKNKNFNRSFYAMEAVFRKLIVNTDFWEDIESRGNGQNKFKLKIWRFIKNSSLLPSLEENASEWLVKVRNGLSNFLESEMRILDCSINRRVTLKNLSDNEKQLPLFTQTDSKCSHRLATIHEVKGESLSGVAITGSAQFFNQVVHSVESKEGNEDRRLAFVGMTRAKHLLLVALPTVHLKNNLQKWKNWGFEYKKFT